MSEVSAITPVQHKLLREAIREQLLDLITSGELSPGSRLVEAEVAGRLKTSRIPVREAFLDLSKDGWVDLRARQGAWVHIPQDGEVDDFYDVRGALEAESARLAALRARPEELDKLRELLEQGFVQIRAADYVKAGEANDILHRAITLTADNELLATLTSGMERRVRWSFRQVVEVRGINSWDEHSAILRAIIDHDPEAAAASMRSHINATRDAFHSAKTGGPAHVS
jgi:DNA-binding GntR family transcriptional regulator